MPQLRQDPRAVSAIEIERVRTLRREHHLERLDVDRTALQPRGLCERLERGANAAMRDDVRRGQIDAQRKPVVPELAVLHVDGILRRDRRDARAERSLRRQLHLRWGDGVARDLAVRYDP